MPSGRNHDAKTKAQCMLDFANGYSLSETGRRNKVARTTVKHWWDEFKEKVGKSNVEVKAAAFADAVERMAVATMDMLVAQAELLADPAYLKTQSTADVIAHSRFIKDGLVGFITLQRGINATRALPELPEHVEAELVEESNVA